MSKKTFATEEEFKNKFNEYVQYCISNERLANIAGFCAYCDICRDNFYNQKEYFPERYSKIQEIIEDFALNYKTNGDARVIFYMKNKCGYRDKQEIDNNIKVEDSTKDNIKNLTTEELKKLAGE